MSGPAPVIRAFVFLQAVSILNSIKQRLLRLRQPKYLFGAIVGAAYMYYYFFRRLLQANAAGSAVAVVGLAPEMASQFAALAGLVVFSIMVFAWLMPNDRAGLKFSEAEVAFLFPAPLTRTALIQFRLLRSQTGIFVSATLMSLLFGRDGSLAGSAWQHAAGMWLILSMLSLHSLGASFACERLRQFGIHPALRRLAIGSLLITMAVGGWWHWQGQVSLPSADKLTDAHAMWEYVDSVLGAAPLSWVLLPFKVWSGRTLPPIPSDSCAPCCPLCCCWP